MRDDHQDKTLYEVLGVPRDAMRGDIRDAYSRLVSEMRKESAAPDPQLAALAKVAVETLTDPDRRAQYDRTLDAPKPAHREENVEIFLGTPARVRRKKEGGPGLAIAVAVAAVLLLAAGGAAYWYFIPEPVYPAAEAGLSPQQVADEVGRRIGRVRAALMSGEVRDLGIAVAAAENEMVTTCRGFVAGAQLTVKVASHAAQKAELARVHEKLDVCTLSVRGATAGLELRGSIVPASERLLAIVPHRTGGQPIWQAVHAVKPIQDPVGPALEVKAAEPLENGTPLFDSQARLVGLVVAPHPYGEGVAAALGASRINQSRGH